MHITFWFTSRTEKFMRLPSASLHLFQSVLYSLLPPEEAAYLHDEGYDSDGRTFKMFAMGWPAASSRPTFGNGTALFPLPVRLTVSTPHESLIQGFTSCALGREDIRVGNNHVICSKLETERYTAGSTRITVRTLSPITCYISAEKDGRRYTEYLSPGQPEFQEGIHANLLRKFRVLYPEREAPAGTFRITPLGEPKRRVSMYDRESSFPIKGWWGRFRLEGDEELLQTALDCGLGAKNSGGWGCIVKE